MRCAKTCFLPAKTHKICRKTQNSFVPYLTQKCPALLLRYPVCALPTARLRCTPPVCDKRCSRRRRRAFLAHRSLHTLRLPLTPPLAVGKLVAAATRSPPFLCHWQRSGRSPIIQDGKLVGAVTHVLVNDPTMGYGIFIENMLNAA